MTEPIISSYEIEVENRIEDDTIRKTERNGKMAVTG